MMLTDALESSFFKNIGEQKPNLLLKIMKTITFLPCP